MNAHRNCDNIGLRGPSAAFELMLSGLRFITDDESEDVSNEQSITRTRGMSQELRDALAEIQGPGFHGQQPAKF